MLQQGFEFYNAHKSLADWPSIATFLHDYTPKKVCKNTFDYVATSEITVLGSSEVIDHYIGQLGQRDNAMHYALETEDVRKKAAELAADSSFPCLNLKVGASPYDEALFWYSGICELYLLQYNAEFKEFIEKTHKGEAQGNCMKSE